MKGWPSVGVAYSTDRGWVRDANEDAAAAVRLPGTAGMAWVWVAAVADGIGGNAGGELASHSAVNAFILTVQSLVTDGVADPAQLIERGFAEANDQIAVVARSAAGNSEMGTTLTTALVWGRRLWVGHIGDSRLYVLRGGQARQITRDHVLRGMLAKYLGAGSPHVPDIAYEDLRDGDVALLGTDGLFRRLPESEISRIVRASRDVHSACDALVAAAKERDGSDNITAACIAVGRKVFRKPVSAGRRSTAVLLLAVLLAMCVVIWELAKPRRDNKRASDVETAVAKAGSDAVRLGLKIQDGRIEISQGPYGILIGGPTESGNRVRSRDIVGRIADQTISLNLVPDLRSKRVRLTFERTGDAKPRTLGWSIDGATWVQSKSALADWPKESIAFNLAGTDDGTDVPVRILFGRDLRGTATESGDAQAQPGTTKPKTTSRQDDRVGHRDRGAGAQRPMASSPRARGRHGAPAHATGATAASTHGSFSARESSDRNGSRDADATQH